MKMNTYELLKNMNILKDVEENIIREMSEKCFMRIYEKEEILFTEGELNENIYIICSGKAIVSKFSEDGEEKIIYILQEEGLINEMSIDGKNTSTTISIMENSKILCFLKKDVIKWMQRDFNFNMIILNSLTSKLRRSFRQIRNLGLKKTNSRIAARLWKLCRDYGEKESNHILIDINITQTKLAAMVGTSRESVSRFLKQLEREKIIKQKNQKITILNLNELEKHMK